MSKSLWKLVKAFLVSVLFLGGVAYSATVNDTLQCPSPVQAGSKSAPWACPALPNFTGEEVEAYLSDIDFKTGNYACTYKYKQSGARIQGCTFSSTYYDTEMKKIEENIVKKVDSFSHFSTNSELNILGTTGVEGISSNIDSLINGAIDNLKAMKTASLDDSTTIAKTNVSIENLRTTIKKSLIDPYTGVSPDKKDGNFALFLAGLVTLDSDVVTGYDEASGELMISSDWRTKATAVSSNDPALVKARTAEQASPFFSSFFSNVLNGLGLTKEVATDVIPSLEGISIASWVEIFEMKMWGFYYDLNRKFDIGFDLISTKILFMMFTWFVLFSGVRRGVGYLLNSDSSFKMTEDKWIKTLVIMLSVVTFYISVPTEISSNLDGKSATATELNKEFHKNKTLAKGIIRMTAGMGQYMGTMMSDLGLSAYLTFLIKKQNVYSGAETTRMLQEAIQAFPMYYPSYEIVKECRGYYDASDADFYNDSKLIANEGFTVNESYTSAFFTANRIEGIDLSLCSKAYTLIALAPKETAEGVLRVNALIANKDAITAKSMEYLITNNIVSQTKLGWINTFSVPISYFIFKNSELFMSTGLDNDAIEKKAEAFVDNIGTRDGGAVERSDQGSDANGFSLWRVTTTNAFDSGSRILADLSGNFLSMGMYNLLPAFSGMRSAIHEYMSNVYTDKYALWLEPSKSLEGEEEATGFIKGFIKKAMSIVTIGGRITKILDYLTPDVSDSLMWRSMITFFSYFIAIYMWKVAFGVMLTVLIGTMSLIKIVLYFKNLLIHTMTSLVYFLWAFAGGNGSSKLMGFLKDTMILMFYPVMIVMSIYIFIFEFELLNILYSFVMSNIIEGQRSNISLMNLANNGDGSALTAYFSLSMLQNFSEIVIQIFGVVLAYLTIMKLPEMILRKLGISEGEHSVSIGQDHDTVNSRGMDRVSNPMS